MYTIIEIKDLLKSKKDYKNYKLCYIDSIPQTYTEWSEKTQEYMKTEEYRRNKELYGWGYNDPNLRVIELPTKEYKPGKQEYYAYFADVTEMGDVWGDDHDDVPFECNAEKPYDEIYIEGKERKEIEIIQIPFIYPKNYIDNFTCITPRDMNFTNSPWSCEDVNLGAVPWLFARTHKRKGKNTGVSILAGTNPYEFIDKLKEIYTLFYETIDIEKFEILGLFKNINRSEKVCVIGNDKWVIGYNPDTLTFAEVYRDNDSYYPESEYITYRNVWDDLIGNWKKLELSTSDELVLREKLITDPIKNLLS